MIEEIKADCEITACDLFLNKDINHNFVSKRTIQRFLNDQGYVARRMLKTHYVSELN